MKTPDAEQLKRLYPPMTADFSARMDALVDALPARKEEPIMKRKISLGLALAAVLALMMLTTAVAASLGLFAQLGQRDWADDRLPDLDAAATPVGKTVTTADGYTVTIEQAYYDGDRLIISYRLTGDRSQVELGEGAPDHVWQNEDPDAAYSIAFDGDDPASMQMEAWLTRGRECWARHRFAALHDGLFLADGTYLDIVNGDDLLIQPDGSAVGWKECRVPAERAAEELQCKAVLFRGETLYYQDGGGIRMDYAHGEDTDVPFTVRKSESALTLRGGFLVNDVYTAEASLRLSPFDLEGTVTLRCCQDWYNAWNDWDFQGHTDVISDWALYAGEERIETRQALQGVACQAPDTLVFELTMRHGGRTEGLRLVPVYEDSGEHPEEAIVLAPQPVGN